MSVVVDATVIVRAIIAPTSRADIRPYDAAFVALGEQLGQQLLTRDAGPAGAPGPRCAFQLVS